MANSASKSRMNHLTWTYDELKGHGGPETVLAISPELVHFCDGNHKFAVFLSNLLFWHVHSKTGWIYKTWRDWFLEAALTKNDISTATTHFRERGLLATQVKKAKNGSPTVHYQLQFDRYEEALMRYFEYRQSMEWKEQESRIRYSDFQKKEIAKSAKTSNRTDNKNNSRKNTQNTPKPPKGAMGSRRVPHPPMEDPMCVAIAEVCKLDPVVNERRIRSLAHKFRLAGYKTCHIDKLQSAVWDAMPDTFTGNITPLMAERYILGTLDEDEQDAERNGTLYAIIAGKPDERIWSVPGPKVTASCLNCGARLSTYVHSSDKDGRYLYCSHECLAAAK